MPFCRLISLLLPALSVLPAAEEEMPAAPSAPEARPTEPSAQSDLETRLADWKTRAEQGDADAARQVALRYQFAGRLAEAFDWSKRSLGLLTEQAQGGGEPAILKLAVLHLQGDGLAVPRNPETAVYWFAKAAEAGNPTGAYMAARLLESDKEHPQPDKAAEYDKKAFTAYKQKMEAGGDGAGEAAYWLGFMYLKGQGVEADPGQALRCLKHADEAGVRAAAEQLAFVYSRGGDGIAPDPEKNFYYRKRLADRWNIPEDLYLTATCYLNGVGVAADPEAGAVYMKKSADAAFLPALITIAAQHMRKGEYAEAYALYKRAASLGHGESLTQIGKMLIAGQGTAKDEEKGAACLEQAANRFGDPVASYELARLFESQGRQEQSDSWYFVASERGHPGAMARRGMLHLIPGSGYAWNPVRSYLWWRAGRDGGDEACARNLNLLLWLGIPLALLLLFGLPCLLTARIQRRNAKKERESAAAGKEDAGHGN
ncbi:MAG: sel1 repeat family protein [Akkermansiaceae bacterium]|nr:sel1 repeat family protein [Akkermansiaceae bacterium]